MLTHGVLRMPKSRNIRRTMKMRATILIMTIAIALLSASCNESGGDMPAYGEESAEELPAASEGARVAERIADEVGVKRIVYHVGPVDLPGGYGTDSTDQAPLTMRFQIDEPMWVTGFEPNVVDDHGTKLPNSLLSLAVMSNMHEQNPLCEEAAGGNPFFVASSTLSSINLPQGYGYPLLPTDPVEISAYLKNAGEEGFSNVYFEVTLIARPITEFAKLADITPVLMEFEPCNHDSISVEPDSFYESETSYSVGQDGSLVMALGVIGDYGARVGLRAKDAAVPFWESYAMLDDSHHVITLTENPFEDSAGVDLKAGDTITMEVSYDNYSKDWIDDAPAAAMLYLAPK